MWKEGPQRRPTVRVAVSVDWEGEHLRSENLDAFEHFHAAHPEVPLTHFLNAGYFTKFKGQLSENYQWSPHQAFSPIDDFGLHVHGLKALVVSSGVQYRSGPSVSVIPEQAEKEAKFRKKMLEDLERLAERPEWLKPLRDFVDPKSAAIREQFKETAKGYLSRDLGWDVDISAYTIEELQAIISNSKAILEEQGLTVGQSFRAGAWMGAPNVLEAIRREGFLVNSSAVGFDEMVEELSSENDVLNDSPLPDMVREIWPNITSESQPFVVETPAGWILEMPDTGGMADYSSVKQMVDQVDKAVQKLDSEDRFVHLGFHQESAAEFAPNVIAAIDQIQLKHGDRVVFETLKASAQRALSSQRLKNGHLSD